MQKNKKGEIEIKMLIIKGLAALVHEYNIELLGSTISQTGERFISQGNLYNKGARFFLDLILEHTSEIILEPKGGKYGYKVLYVTKDPAIIKDIDFFFGTPYYSNILKNILKEKERIASLERREKDLERREKKLFKTGTFKKSAHLTEQTLKYINPNEKTPNLWDILKPSTREEIKERGKDERLIVEGISLTVSENKLIDSFCKILHEQSENENEKSDLYYMGRDDLSIEIPFGDRKDKAPGLKITLFHIAKEYTGSLTPSGKDLSNTYQILVGLAQKDFLLKYTETIKKPNGGGYHVKEIEGFKRLISIVHETNKDLNERYVLINKTTEIIVYLNPIFRRQIDSKFIIIPNDINKRTALAYGSKQISESTIKLRDMLLLQIGNKNSSHEIGLEKLLFKVCPKDMRSKQKPRAKKSLQTAIETNKKLGLITGFETKPDQKGELKIIFQMNKDWIHKAPA